MSDKRTDCCITSSTTIQIVEHKLGQLHVFIFLFSASPLKSDKRNIAKPPMKQLMAFVF